MDPVLTLHLAVLTIFLISTQCMIHASGKFVSSILSFLQPSLNQDQCTALVQYHDLVLKLLTAPSGSDEVNNVTKELQTRMEIIKNIACTFKKSSVTNVD